LNFGTIAISRGPAFNHTAFGKEADHTLLRRDRQFAVAGDITAPALRVNP